MGSRRRKPESLWARKEEVGPQNEPKDFDSNFLGDNSPKQSNSETNDVLMSDDFSTRETVQGNENMLLDNEKYRMKTSRDRDRSRSRSSSPNRTRGPHRDRTRGRDSGRARASPTRGSGSNRPEYSSSRDRNSNSKSSDGYKKETQDYHRNDRIGYNDQDHRRQSNQSIKTPCRFFIMGNCNRNNCKFSHDPNPKFETFPNSGPDFDEKNKSWNDPSWNNPESGGFDDVSRDMDTNSNQDSQFIRDNSQFDGQSISLQFPTNLNGNGPIEASRNDNPQVMSETLANALGLLHSLPNSASGPVDSDIGQPVKTGLPETQTLVEPVKHPEVNENPTGQPDNKNIGKPEVQGKVEEGNIGNDEKAMRAFKTALVEFVKEILKPTWKEGKMDREVYKTIVKKVVEKVTSTIQGNQIPKTQEKIDQYLAFSKSKIAKLVEAYVGKFQKA